MHTDDGWPWLGHVTRAVFGSDGHAKSYMWRPDAAEIPGHPWNDLPDAVVVTAADEIQPTADHTNPAVDAGLLPPTTERIELEVSPGPQEWNDIPVVDAVAVRCANGVAHIHDVTHGPIDVPDTAFVAALGYDREALIRTLTENAPHLTLTGTEPDVALAALAARYTPESFAFATQVNPLPTDLATAEVPLPPAL